MVYQALNAIIINTLWNVWSQSHIEGVEKVIALILYDKRWALVEYVFLSFTKPIMRMIRCAIANIDQPHLSEIYDDMYSMVEKIRTVIEAKERDCTKVIFKRVQKIIIDCWNKITMLHFLKLSLLP